MPIRVKNTKTVAHETEQNVLCICNKHNHTNHNFQ